MNKLFPLMFERPATRTTISGIVYGFFGFLVIPLFIQLVGIDAGRDLYGDWLDLGYHLFNFLAVLMLFLPYLYESFLNVQINPRLFFKTVAVCVIAVVGIRIGSFGLNAFVGNDFLGSVIFGSLITTESDLLHFSTSLLYEQPVWGTLCMVFLTPITTSCLLYACTFAPLCNNRPWLAYLITTVILFLIRFSMVICFWPFKEELAIFLIQLPVHLIACWAYQKTDTVWTPIAIHSISNLLLSLLSLVAMDVI